jgi:hypothetical protein
MSRQDGVLKIFMNVRECPRKRDAAMTVIPEKTQWQMFFSESPENRKRVHCMECLNSHSGLA